ncbi:MULTISPECIES: L,D-transpeptidase [Rhodopseudomonas]|uniref:L,D-TPase catalytic domain-containing protein n=1 Tax=Rhodopseudomonas palustris TaxID=1076 RepID=A0A0D7EKB7_RHOPL|nr:MULTISPECIES: L,D-transpeptidase [Rhodopseudomonas]KIZ41096.1 hypothetical protein OO17_15955 [Rhodopseudomonas palustris]MDF3812353.1 L,D-transpeptidase [Rhodopseudomonas sp. BAL398]WOK18335.1 L,D-transpeptidase [Rhodopseudomonas sp. BAL398]
MRFYLVPVAALMMLGAAGVAQAKVAITVDKDNQQMTVAVDGVPRYHWPVSTGNPSHETPNGSFQTFRMEADHFSKEFDDAPMPHSIFFTKRGHAIHGTDSTGKLGVPVSHGCVRLSRANASTLYALVQREGVLNTTVNLTGSSRVALARISRSGTKLAATSRDPASEATDDAVGAPVELAPPVTRRPPQVADDGYIYPADGSSSAARYPAPRGYRRQYEAQAQPQYDDDDDSGYAPQVYAPQVYAPRPVYRQRGLFGSYPDY